MTRLRLALFALGMAGATPAFAQQVSTPPVVPTINTTRPAGSMIRCRDGSWAPAGATVAACDAHEGLAYRFPEKTPPPPAKTRPDAGLARVAPPPAPQGMSAPAVTSSSMRSAANAKAPEGPVAPPANATLACVDGTFLTGPADPDRCKAYGGLTAILPKKKP